MEGERSMGRGGVRERGERERVIELKQRVIKYPLVQMVCSHEENSSLRRRDPIECIGEAAEGHVAQPFYSLHLCKDTSLFYSEI